MLALLAAGVLLRRIPALPADAPKALDTLVLWFALPGLVLAVVPDLELTTSTLVPVAVAWGTLVASALVVLALGRLFRWSRKVVGTLLLVVPLGNTSFLGIPAVNELLSPAHVPFAVLYDQLGSFLALATWGTVVAARYGSGSTPTFGATVGRVLTFPPFVALVAAFVVRETGMPALAEDLADRAAATLVPLTMLVVGMRLRLPQRLADVGPLVVGLGIKMALMPAIAFGAYRLLDGSGLAWETSVLEAGMPPMVTASVVATAAGMDEDLSSALVGVGVLVALLSLPALAGLLG